MARVRAKFFVAELGTYTPNGAGGGKVVMQPVAQGSEENKAFWEATPNGKLEMFVDNPEAFARFQVGKEYYIDFTPAPRAKPEAAEA
jgi:hypothetical protein